MEKKFLGRDEILAIPLRVEELYVKEWDTWVRIRELSAKEIAGQGQFAVGRDGKVDMSKAVQIPVKMCLEQVVNEDGSKLFSPKDILRLEQKHGAAVQRIANAVRNLSGLGEDESSDALAKWLEVNHPDILEEYRESQNPVTAAEENFTGMGDEDSPTV